MTPEAFRRWRKRMGWKQAEAAGALEVCSNTISNFERGLAEIKRPVRLAMLAIITLGVRDYDGPEE